MTTTDRKNYAELLFVAFRPVLSALQYDQRTAPARTKFRLDGLMACVVALTTERPHDPLILLIRRCQGRSVNIPEQPKQVAAATVAVCPNQRGPDGGTRSETSRH